MKYLLILSLLFYSITIRSQSIKPDKLLRSDKSQLEVKVVEVTSSEIKYRRYSNLDGPIYSIQKSELNAIVYGNGEIETFEAADIARTADVNKNKETDHDTLNTNIDFTKKKGTDVWRRFISSFEAGYSRYSDIEEDLNGIYAGFAIGYRFNRALSADIALNYGFYFLNKSTKRITELNSGQLALKGIYRFYFSKRKQNDIFLTGGVGYSEMFGEYTDYTTKGFPTYKLNGYDGFGYIIGGGVKFARIGGVLEYSSVNPTFSIVKLGLIVGI